MKGDNFMNFFPKSLNTDKKERGDLNDFSTSDFENVTSELRKRYIRTLKTLHPNFETLYPRPLKTLHPNFENVIFEFRKRYIRTLKTLHPNFENVIFEF